MKLNLLINKRTNDLINKYAEEFGVTKRNIITIALLDILSVNITAEKMEMLEDKLHLDYRTSITATDPFMKKIIQINTHGYPRWKFFGYLICDYFSSSERLNHFNESENEKWRQHDYVVVSLSQKSKRAISEFCYSNSITINALFVHYILNKDIEIGLLDNSNENTSYYKINLREDIKQRLVDTAKEHNMFINYYLRLIVEQIKKDYKL